MYNAAVDRNNILCLCQQTNVRRDELYEQPVPGAERREMVAPPPGHASHSAQAIYRHATTATCRVNPKSLMVQSVLC